MSGQTFEKLIGLMSGNFRHKFDSSSIPVTLYSSPIATKSDFLVQDQDYALSRTGCVLQTKWTKK